MMSTTTPGQAAQTAPSPQAAHEHWPRRRRWAAAGAAVAAVAVAAVVLAVTRPFAAARPPGAGGSGNAYATGTATVTERPLSSQTQVAATVGDAGTYTVVNQAQGTITALPDVGQVVRQGQVLYQVSGSPVVLLYGPVPAWRGLSEGLTGSDVAELNSDLVSLGYAASAELGARSAWDYFGAETAHALEKLQARLGVAQTGILGLGQAVFLPTAAQITALGATTVLGGPAMPGSDLLSASSTTPVVTIALDPALQTDVKIGEHVAITLPDNHVTPGLVSQVSNVATTAGSSGGSGGSNGSSSLAIPVEISLTNPQAADGLNQAPVEVTITTGRVSNALVVPVDALVAQANGGYAVEVIGAAASGHLVPVSLGLFDDANGLVQVSGTGLATGQHVVVPTV
jgi:hypothetical protein